jgi:hypothetical protein
LYVDPKLSIVIKIVGNINPNITPKGLQTQHIEVAMILYFYFLFTLSSLNQVDASFPVEFKMNG